MVGPCTTPSKYKKKQSVVCFGESDDELSSGLKEILRESERVYQHTRIRTGTITPMNYNALTRGIDVNEAHPVIAKSQLSNSSIEKEASAYMEGTLKEVAKGSEEQA